MKTRSLFWAALLGVGVISLAVSVPATAAPAADSTATGGEEPDPTSWYAFPTLFYTPETSFGGGAAGGYFVSLGTGRPSSLQGDVSATLKGQYAANLRPELYRRDGRQRLFGDIAFSRYPDVFYGIGPETTEAMEEDFTSRYVDAIVQVEQRIATGWRAGLRMRFRHEIVSDIEPSGLLDGATVPGAGGGTVLGMGLIVTRDTRDRAFYPQRGTYVTAYVLGHPTGLGSDFDFTRAVIDARKYVPVSRHLVALQAYGEAVGGTAPFSVLPRLGGPLRMRGYLEGRFRDDVYATAQAEWRFPVWGRFGGALFGGAGAVAGRIDALGADGLEAAGGAGIRYRLNDEGVHIRLDYAIGREGAGLYITARDPF